MYSKQETFNRVATHLLTQSKKCLDPVSRGCLYRDGKGACCAAGCLLTDRTYDEDFEGQSIEEIIEDVRTDWFGHNAKLVGALQDLHDRWSVRTWKDHLYNLANLHSLDDSVLKQFRRRGDKYTRIEKPRWGTFRAKSKKARS